MKKRRGRHFLFWFAKFCGCLIQIAPLLIPFTPIILEFSDILWSWVPLLVCSIGALLISISLNCFKMGTCTIILRFILIFLFFLIGFVGWLLFAPFLVLSSVLATIDTEQQSRGIIILLIVFVLYARETFSLIRNKFARFLGEIMYRIQQNPLQLQTGRISNYIAI